MLSKPYPESSGGSMDRTSMSIPSRSLIAFAYSTRLRRWMGGRPGSGWAAAARSSAVARFEIRSWYEALSGRGRPASGIAADRSFRTTFSHTGAAAPTSRMSSPSRARPAVFSLWLWHVAQYWSISARLADGCPSPEGVCRAVAVATGVVGGAARTGRYHSRPGAAPSSANAVRKIRALGIDIALTIPPMLVLADPGSQMQAESLTRCRRPFSLRYGGGHLLAAAVAIGSLGVGSLAAGASDTRLADAVQRQNSAAVRALLSRHIDVNAPQPDGATAIAWAAHWNDLETADLLLRAGSDVDAANAFGVTPLSLACTNGSVAMVERLLAAAADP